MKAVALIRLSYLALILFLSIPSKTVCQSISGVINSYYKVTAVNNSTANFTLTSTTGLTVGSKVLIMQMKGAIIDVNNTVAFGNLNNISGAGNYEFNTICAITGNDILMKFNLVRFYDATGSVQIITVPQYNVVTVTDTLRASAWNATTGTGGVLVMEANTINLNSGLSVNGAGFTGGPLSNYPAPTYDCTIAQPNNYYFTGLAASGYFSAGPKGEGVADFISNGAYGRGKQANGGGGGNNHNSGGAGGGNFGAGGNGGTRSNVPFPNCTGPFPGIGGISLSAQGYTIAANRMFMGGGGGAGHENNAVGLPGGNGGGIVILTADAIVATGRSISANGMRPYTAAMAATDPFASGGDGAGGGGAGGTIVLNINQVIGSITASATGAKGGDAGRTGATGDCPGPGGGGGGGVVWMKGSGTIANVTTVVTAGGNGVVHAMSATAVCRGVASGAQAGGAGGTADGFIPVQSNPLTCVPLPIRELQSFTGKMVQEGALLQWGLSSVTDIAAYELQRSVDQVTYTTVYNRTNSGAFSYKYTDATPFSGTMFYRLKIVRVNGAADYSSVIKVSKYSNDPFQWISLQPNPASRQVSLSVLARKTGIANVYIYAATGQQVAISVHKLPAGYSAVQVPVNQLPEGVYWLVADASGIKLMQRFIKK